MEIWRKKTRKLLRKYKRGGFFYTPFSYEGYSTIMSTYHPTFPLTCSLVYLSFILCPANTVPLRHSLASRVWQVHLYPLCYILLDCGAHGVILSVGLGGNRDKLSINRKRNRKWDKRCQNMTQKYSITEVEAKVL